jgi:hypothetical protein
MRVALFTLKRGPGIRAFALTGYGTRRGLECTAVRWPSTEGFELVVVDLLRNGRDQTVAHPFVLMNRDHRSTIPRLG